MLTIICGDNLVDSRRYYSDLQLKFRQEKKEIIVLNAKDIFNLDLWLKDALTLFASEKVFFTENLERLVNKRQKELWEKLSQIINDQEIQLYDWEGKAQWELKLKSAAKIYEFKLSATIFKLIDNFYPGNKQNFIKQLNSLAQTVEAGFIFAMLVKQVRNLILLKTGQELSKIAPYQQLKLKQMVKYWHKDKLFQVYEALLKIDINLKTSSSPFSLLQSLDIIACYFL
jgi:hypothetical protein